MKLIKNKGFTLIELLVTIAVLSILVLLGAPRFVGTVEKARETQIKNDVKAVESVIIDQLSKENRFPWESTITYEELFNKLDDASLYDKTGTLSEIIEGDYIEIPPSYAEEMTGSKLDGVFYANYEGGILYLRDSETKYIYVSNARDLQNVKDNLDGNFIQTRDINLEGVDFEPLRSSSTPFTGTYNGGNYVIRGLEIKGESYQGLFGRTEGATIRNVGLENVNITGSGNYVGGLVGYAHSSTIENSYATGPVTGSDRVGGLVGYIINSTTISNSYATGEVTGNQWAGGLVGVARNSTTISNSYSTGEVTGTNHAGGLVGYAHTNTKISNSYATGSVKGTGYSVGGLVGGAYENTEISNSYVTGSVNGSNYAGGLVGWANSSTTINNSYAAGSVTGSSMVGGLVGRADDSSTISNSYVTGSVKGTNDVGGLVGWADSGNAVTNSYWNTKTTGQTSSSGGGEDKSTKEMKKKETYTDSGWDFETVWKIDEGNDYPKFR